ncbi:MAG: hypothetical protein M1827_000992 [Pycnora praestabilis]|nr:MAG: hypothetical protein M1827_000992 [Pycnora praestabilis]
MSSSSSSSSTQAALSHEERTATEPRDNAVHKVILSKIERVNDTIRLLRLSIPPKRRSIEFLPGQWLDVHIPGQFKAGGFTITSTPRDARPAAQTSSSSLEHQGYLELAIQKSPRNPPAAWLWQPKEQILGSELRVRVGGSFVWPPPSVNVKSIKRAVFIAGGVGINPLISVISHLNQVQQMPEEVVFLYTLRTPGPRTASSDILFLPRLQGLTESTGPMRLDLQLFLTGDGVITHDKSLGDLVKYRRINRDDLLQAIGDEGSRDEVVAYVCGPPAMTDEFVDTLKGVEKMENRVLCGTAAGDEAILNCGSQGWCCDANRPTNGCCNTQNSFFSLAQGNVIASIGTLGPASSASPSVKPSSTSTPPSNTPSPATSSTTPKPTTSSSPAPSPTTSSSSSPPSTPPSTTPSPTTSTSTPPASPSTSITPSPTPSSTTPIPSSAAPSTSPSQNSGGAGVGAGTGSSSSSAMTATETVYITTTNSAGSTITSSTLATVAPASETSASSAPSASSKSTPIAEIVGPAVGVGVPLIALVLGLGIFFARRQKKKRNQDAESPSIGVSGGAYKDDIHKRRSELAGPTPVAQVSPLLDKHELGNNPAQIGNAGYRGVHPTGGIPAHQSPQSQTSPVHSELSGTYPPQYESMQQPTQQQGNYELPGDNQFPGELPGHYGR